MNVEAILMVLKLLDLVATATIRSTSVQANFAVLRDDVETMIRENRDPTEVEWVDMNQRADNLHAQIQRESEG